MKKLSDYIKKFGEAREDDNLGTLVVPLDLSAESPIVKHIRETHDFAGVKCDRPSCEDSAIWTTYKKLAEHNASHSWPPRKCPMSCKSKTFFKDKNGLMAHLKGVHNMLTKEASAMAQQIEVKEED